jgi:SAM-dependent methyltransferase
MRVEANTPDEIESLLRRLSYRKRFLTRLTVDAADEFAALPEADERSLHNILDTGRWPPAAREEEIVTTEADRAARGRNIIRAFVDGPVAGRRVLDFGCGDGHVARAAAEMGAAVSVGYDLVAGKWDGTGATAFSTDMDAVRTAGPYDIVFLYDVLDHAEDPVNVLVAAADLLSPEGVIYARLHPWCSRHGGHLFRAANKAYLHLFLSPEAGRLLTPDYPTQKVVLPLKTYRGWVTAAGLKMIRPEIPTVQEPEPFFSAQLGAIVPHWIGCGQADLAAGRTFPTQPMSIQFVDCVIGR